MDTRIAIILIVLGLFLIVMLVINYFETERHIKYLSDYRLDELMKLKEDINKMEQSFVIQAFMALTDEEKEAFMQLMKEENEKRAKEAKNGNK